MPVLTIENHTVAVDPEGFLTDYADWDDDLAVLLGDQIGIALTDRHWAILRFLRQDFADQGETATLRRTSLRCDIPIRELFAMFPGKPAKKMAYIAGLPKPRGCV